LKDSYRKHSPELPLVQKEPFLDLVHSEPRYRDIVQENGAFGRKSKTNSHHPPIGWLEEKCLARTPLRNPDQTAKLPLSHKPAADGWLASRLDELWP